MKDNNFQDPGPILLARLFNNIFESVILQQGDIPLLFRSKQVISIFRISPQELCRLRKNNLVPVVETHRAFYYDPKDIFEFLLTKKLNRG